MNNISLNENKIIEDIEKIKNLYGKKLLLLAHHYQRNEIVNLSHYKGDSFELAKIASQDKLAEYIVYNGVDFMAECAAILAGPKQKVYMPEISSTCPMSNMADLESVEQVWNELQKLFSTKILVPIAYMNSPADIKAFCGKNNGTICTSSSAKAIFQKALEKGKIIFFLPDQHLGINTSKALDIPDNKIHILSERNISKEINKIKNSKVLLWNGYCYVHSKFSLEDVKLSRKKFPQAKIIVHPECNRDVVKAADASGSTSQIENYVKNATKGSTIIIGTEINFISRLAKENTDKKVIELKRSLCVNMYKINLENLHNTLQNLESLPPIKISTSIMENAKIALNRMLGYEPWP